MRSWFALLVSLGLLGACGFSADSALDGGLEGGGDGTGAGPTGAGGFVETSPPATDNAEPENSLAEEALLAGDWDDSVNFSPWYVDFRDQYLSYRDDVTIDVTGRQVIVVESESGAPFPNVKVSIVGANTTAALGLTATNGKVQLFPAHDPVLPVDVSTVFTIEGPDVPLQEAFVGDVDPDGTLKVVVPDLDPVNPLQLDIALVIDTTLSLGDEILYLQTNLRSINDEIALAFAGTEVRYGLVLYRDVGEAYTTQVTNFTSDLTAIADELDKVTAEGGGDYPEALDEGLAEMLSLEWQTGNQARIAFVIGDAPAHEDQLETINALTEDARQRGIRIYPIGASGTGDRAQFYFRQAALMTLGRYLFLTTDTSLEDQRSPADDQPIGTMPCYRVQNLRDVMMRVIASELTGMAQPVDPAKLVGSIGGPDESGVCTFGDTSTAQAAATSAAAL